MNLLNHLFDGSLTLLPVHILFCLLGKEKRQEVSSDVIWLNVQAPLPHNYSLVDLCFSSLDLMLGEKKD